VFQHNNSIIILIFNFSNHIREKRDFVSGGAAAGVAGTVT